MENEISSEWEQVQSPLDLYSESSVFPPGDHQDLPISTPEETNQQLQVPPLSDSSVSSLSPANGNSVRSWRRLLLKLDLRNGIFWIARSIEKYGTRRKVGACAFSLASAAVLLVSLLRAKAVIWWRRRMLRETSSRNLMHIIEQKDKKITQLLLQVAQMNEILLVRRRVQVIRVN